MIAIHKKEPYKLANRKSHPENTVIRVGSSVIGGDALTLIAGPCTVESEEQLLSVAQAAKKSGATLLRGGAFKPRTSPYAFRGLGEEGLLFLKKAKELTGLPVISEIMDISQLPLFGDVDIIQVGARNMQNYYLLNELGKQNKPVMLKRGQGATCDEWLMSAEYIMKGGNGNVILCERGIRTFENHTRNTLDISAVPVIKKLSHLPVIVDPSHASGKAEYVPALSMAAVAAGADGLIIEVHNDPAHALCDGAQAINGEQLEVLSRRLFALHGFLNKPE